MLHKRNVLIFVAAVTLCLAGITLARAVRQDLEPGEVYSVLLGDCESNEWESIGCFTAMKNGGGHLHVRHLWDVSEMCVLVAQGDLPQSSMYELADDGDVNVTMPPPTDVVKKKASRMGLRKSKKYMKSLGRA